MDPSDVDCCNRFGHTVLETLREIKAISALPPEQHQPAILRMFELPTEDQLMRPGEAAGLSVKERIDEAERLGLVYSRDVAHGKMYRHPIITTWITCISQSPGDHRSGMNCASELRDGWREARDRLMELVAAAPTQNIKQAPGEPNEKVLSCAKSYENSCEKIGERRARLSHFYANSSAFIRQSTVDDAVASKACTSDCDCSACQADRIVKELKLSGCTEEGWRLFNSAVRRAQRDTDNMPVRTILAEVGINGEYGAALSRLWQLQLETPFPPAIGEKINDWIEFRREQARLEKEAKKAKYLPKTPQQKAQAWIDAPNVPETTALSDFLFAVNNMKKAMDAEVLRYKKDLKEAHAIIQDLVTASTNTAELDAMRKEVEAAKSAASAAELQMAGLGEANSRAEVAEQALAKLRTGVAQLLAEVSAKTEGVRALRMMEDLTAITDHLLNGAIALGVDIHSEAAVA